MKKKNHSLGWHAVKDLTKKLKMQKIAIIVLCFLLLLSVIFGFSKGRWLLKFKFFNDEWELFLANCGFSDDELEIVTFLRKEWSFSDIAAELCISYSTLTRRRKRIIQKITRYISNIPHWCGGSFFMPFFIFDNFLTTFWTQIEKHFLFKSFKIFLEVKEMNITQYILSKPELESKHFPTVYQTIITLIGDGLLSMEDLNKVKTVQSSNGFYKN